MELFLIDKQDKSMKIGIKDADSTLITPLLDKLNNDKDVKLVRYIETHPELDTPAIYIEMNNGNPSEAIAKAAKDISDYFGKK